MSRNNSFKCGCISPCNDLKPAATSNTLNQTNDPLTTTPSTTVVFAMAKIAFIGFNENRLTIGVHSSRLCLVSQQSVVTLLTEVVIIVDYCIPTCYTLEEHNVLALYLVKPVKEKHRNFLR